jgi:hypothetical protein
MSKSPIGDAAKNIFFWKKGMSNTPTHAHWLDRSSAPDGTGLLRFRDPPPSILPPAIEAIGVQLGISNGALNVAMPEIVLQGPGIATFVGELIAR